MQYTLQLYIITIMHKNKVTKEEKTWKPVWERVNGHREMDHTSL